MRRTADRLVGDAYHWSVLGAGRNQFPVASLSTAMGGHVRVGLEDSWWTAPGEFAQGNAQQVAEARTMIESAGLNAATPDQARALLCVKGQGQQVAQ